MILSEMDFSKMLYLLYLLSSCLLFLFLGGAYLEISASYYCSFIGNSNVICIISKS